jgi:hypothetical protein
MKDPKPEQLHLRFLEALDARTAADAPGKEHVDLAREQLERGVVAASGGHGGRRREAREREVGAGGYSHTHPAAIPSQVGALGNAT